MREPTTTTAYTCGEEDEQWNVTIKVNNTAELHGFHYSVTYTCYVVKMSVLTSDVVNGRLPSTTTETSKSGDITVHFIIVIAVSYTHLTLPTSDLV